MASRGRGWDPARKLFFQPSLDNLYNFSENNNIIEIFPLLILSFGSAPAVYIFIRYNLFTKLQIITIYILERIMFFF